MRHSWKPREGLDAIGFGELNLTGWQGGFAIKNEYLERFWLCRPLCGDPNFCGWAEAKPGIKVRISVDENKGLAILSGEFNHCPDDCRTGAFTLMLRKHARWGKDKAWLTTHCAAVYQRMSGRGRLKLGIRDGCGKSQD